MLLESLLLLNTPKSFVAFLENRVLPALGAPLQIFPQPLAAVVLKRCRS